MKSLGHARAVDVDGASIAYFDVGEGRPLVFVHGYFLSSLTWRKVIPPLANDFRCIAVDLLGAGETRFSGPVDLSTRGQARMLGGLLDALELPSPTLVAHDSGAMVTRLLATERPERIDGLVLSDTEIPGHRVRSFEAAAVLLRVPGMRSAFEWLLGSPLLWNRLLRSAISDPSSFDRDEFLATHGAPLRGDRARRKAMLMAGLSFDPALVDAIEHERLTMPKLVLWGDRDAFISVELARRFFEGLPDPKQFAVVPASGTVPHEERPDAWVEIVRGFLNEPRVR